MRATFPSPPSKEELRSTRVHELIRDYPELLLPFRKLGVDPGEDGYKALSEILPGDRDWVDGLLEEVRWRGTSATW